MAYRRYYISAGTAILTLFLALQFYGLKIIDLTGDIRCLSTCTSYFNVVNPTANSIYIYNKESIKLDFSPKIKDYELYIEYYGKWREIDFTMSTRLPNIPKDRLYVFVFPRYSVKKFKLVGYKEPEETIKWTFGVIGKDELDPLWYSSGFMLNLNGLNQSRTYEYETTANITANVSSDGETYIDILDDTNRYINQSNLFNYTINLLRTNKFSDGNTTKNISSEISGAINIDNRTELYNASFNITGINLVSDLLINYSNNYLYFPNSLIGNNLYQNNFIYSGNSYTNYNLSYPTAESKIIYINFSNQGNYLTRQGYLNFTITSFDLDVGNSFDYSENFTNSNSINSSSLFNTSAPMSVFDDFERDKGIWYCTNETTPEGYICNNNSGYFNFYIGAFWTSYSSAESRLDHTTNEINLNNISRFNITVNYGYSWGHSYGGSSDSTRTLYATDGTNLVQLFSDSYSGSGHSYGSIDKLGMVIHGFKNPDDTWDIYENSTVKSNDVSLSSLSGTITFRVKLTASGLSSPSWPGSSTTYFNMLNINTSGIRLKRLSNGTYESNVNFGKFESTMLKAGSTDIARVYLTLDEYKPEGTSIQYFASNNNGTTYETVVPSNFHTFTSTGKQLKVRFILNSTNDMLSPYIRNYRVQLIPSSPSGLQIDVGSDGVRDIYLNYTLNSTTTPVSYTGNDSGINNYINRSCRSGGYCVIPISFVLDSGGIIQINNLNLTENINPISLNITSLQDLNTITLSPTYSGGTVNFNDIRFDFRGSKNITVYAHNSDYASSINRTIYVKDSKFSLTYPSGWNYTSFYYKKRNQSDVEPYGQNSSHGVWRIDNLAYDGNIDVYLRYNESVNSCLTKQQARGQNFTNSGLNNMSTLNITNITTTAQKLIENLNTTTYGNIRRYSTINCSGSNLTLIHPHICLFSLCTNCAKPFDWSSNCEWVS